MPLDNVIFPDAFRLGTRHIHGVPPNKQTEVLRDFQLTLFESAKRASHRLSRVHIAPGERLLRCVPEGFSILKAREVPDGSAQSTKNRWSGSLIDNTVCRGALYTSIDTNGFLNENIRHSRKAITREIPWIGSNSRTAKYTVFGPASKGYKQLLVGRVYYTFVLKNAITVVDLSPESASGFYAQIESDPRYQEAKQNLRLQPELWRLVFDPIDYTASRPVGLSVLLGISTDGFRVNSAQNELGDLSGSTGLNVVFGGADKQVIDCLEPTGKLIEGKSDGGRQALMEIRGDDTGKTGPILPGSVLPIPTD